MNTAEKIKHRVNGINTDRVIELATKMSQDEEFGRFRFRAHNQWIQGSVSQTVIQDYYAGGNEVTDRSEAHLIGADQPFFLGGKNTAPNSVEYLLHALTSCLMTTLVYHAAVQGIEIQAADCFAEGEMNSKGFFGVSDQVKRGYEKIHVTMQVKSDADIDTLTRLAMYSPVYETISKSVATDFVMKKI